MAGRRAAVKALDWLAFAERVPPNQKAMFISLKTRSDTVAANSVLVTIPEPKDTQTEKINAQEQESIKQATAYIQESKARMTQYENELEKFRNMIPFDQMTMQDLNEAFPETKLDKEKYVYWPHKPITEL